MTQEQLRILLREIEKKNSWGKNELKNLRNGDYQFLAQKFNHLMFIHYLQNNI